MHPILKLVVQRLALGLLLLLAVSAVIFDISGTIVLRQGRSLSIASNTAVMVSNI